MSKTIDRILCEREQMRRRGEEPIQSLEDELIEYAASYDVHELRELSDDALAKVIEDLRKDEQRLADKS